MRKFIPMGLAAMALLVGVQHADAGTVVLTGTNLVEDTYLRGDDSQISTVNNYGGFDFLIVGDMAGGVTVNSLIRFPDLSGLSGQAVTNATLRLWNRNHGNQTSDVAIDVYAVVAGNGDWVEGDGNNAVVPGTSDYRFKIQNTEDWEGGRNGCGVAGTDYVDHLLGSAVATNTTQEWVEFALDASVVQGWIDDPTRNYGLVLTAPGALDGEIAFFYSSEATVSAVPELVLETMAVPQTTDMVYLFGTNQVEDTYLRGADTEVSTTRNYGGSGLLIAGQLDSTVVINTLMRFTDLAGISGRTVTNATLRLYNRNHANQTDDVALEIHEVVAANGDWVEGNGNNDLITGTSDWRFKIQNTAEWAGGRNGCGVEGTDYVTNLVGSAIASNNTSPEWMEFELDASVVQNWLDNTNQHYGLLLTAPGATAGQIAFFDSSEKSTVSGPVLALELLFEKTYEQWAETHGLTGTDALRTTDVEPDGMDNLLEYALGGNPKVDDADAVLPSSSIVEDSGTNWLEYIYSRRLDASARELDYAITLNTNDLVLGAWINIGTDAETGTAAIDADFESVTNRFSTGEDKKFTNLEITEK